jgi:hypothetical protein
MKTPSRLGVLVAALVPALAVVPSGSAQTSAVDQTAIVVQARGVLHEAFAQPADAVPQPGPIVPKQPPDPIPEEPPNQRPDGPNVEWIGGYWAWDADTNEFIWISGGYRDAPEGRKYIAGYWEQTPDGWRWVPGFWAPDNQPELPYVPQPPNPLDVGPNVPPPGADYFWCPGIWIYKETRFVWRPGYYARCRPGFVWISPHYCWTPGGYLFVSGYWDEPLDSCGLLFAPVAFSRPVWRTPGFVWRPSYVVGWRSALASLFIDTRGHHYRYGDWYGKVYADRGIQPWHVAGAKRYDPLWSYYSVVNRNNAGWQKGLTQVYADRLANVAVRPPRTLTDQIAGAKSGGVQVVQPLTALKDPQIKLAKVSDVQLAQNKAAILQQQNAAKVRLKAETTLAKQQPLDTRKVGQPPPTLKVADLHQGITVKGGQEKRVVHMPPVDTKAATVKQVQDTHLPKVDTKLPSVEKKVINNNPPPVKQIVPDHKAPKVDTKLPTVEKKVINNNPPPKVMHQDVKPAKTVNNPPPVIKSQSAPPKVTQSVKPATTRTPAPAARTVTPQHQSRQVQAQHAPRTQATATSNNKGHKKN